VKCTCSIYERNVKCMQDNLTRSGQLGDLKNRCEDVLNWIPKR
jgi:hypothetical protein